MRSRESSLHDAGSGIYDVAVIGGGVNGASLYARLADSGYRTVLLEKNDFASGTSQSSGMMIWGGLLYLKNLDFSAVYKFSRSRERSIRFNPGWVTPRQFRFFPAENGRMSRYPALIALQLYWAMSLFRRRRPKLERHPVGRTPIDQTRGSLRFEEGMLRPSDSRYVLHWIIDHHSDRSIALNHTEVVGGEYDPDGKIWRLEAVDRLAGRELEIRSRTVVNCAGVWTDALNRVFDIPSPYKHIFSKGVYLLLRRSPAQLDPLIFMMAGYDDVLTSIPWGPVEMWGPTENIVAEIEGGFSATEGDVAFLMDQREQRFGKRPVRDDIIGLRSGVRPLPVSADYSGDDHPVDLSRSVQIVSDVDRPWLSVYGGKLTGCVETAAAVARHLERYLPSPKALTNGPRATGGETSFRTFPGLRDPVPSATWCRDHEFCHSLESYLRRRTNIAQWVPRGGLGKDDVHLDIIRDISLELAAGDRIKADHEVAAYRTQINEYHDRILDRV